MNQKEMINFKLINTTGVKLKSEPDDKVDKPLCRVCLRYESQIQDNVSSIYDKRNGRFMYKMINYIANIDIQPEDGLLDTICTDCIIELDNAIHFKQKCEVSNRILQLSKRFSAEFNEHKETEKGLKLSKEGTKEDVTERDVHNIEVIEEPKQETEIYCEEYSTNDYETGSPVSYNNTNNLTQSNEQQEVNNELGSSKRIRIIDLKLICHDCGGSFKTKCKLRVHWKVVHQPNVLICNVCKMQFKSYKALRSHRNGKRQSCTTAAKTRIEGEGRSRKFHCKDCHYATIRISDMKTHLNIHTGDRPWACKLCPKNFTQQSVLQRHLEDFHKNYITELTCHVCGAHCKGRSTIYRHMLMHRKSTYECDICGLILTSKYTLLLHLKRHGDKSYLCDKCPSSFYTSYELHSHKVRVHDKKKVNRKRYHCNICSYSTMHKEIMVKHNFKHTDSNKACEKCGKFFENEDKLNLHIKKHFERYHECSQCKNTYYSKEQLRVHVKRRHKINVSLLNTNNQELIKKKMEYRR